jgi:hypothetical protein
LVQPVTSTASPIGILTVTDLARLSISN